MPSNSATNSEFAETNRLLKELQAAAPCNQTPTTPPPSTPGYIPPPVFRAWPGDPVWTIGPPDTTPTTPPPRGIDPDILNMLHNAISGQAYVGPKTRKDLCGYIAVLDARLRGLQFNAEIALARIKTIKESAISAICWVACIMLAMGLVFGFAAGKLFALWQSQH